MTKLIDLLISDGKSMAEVLELSLRQCCAFATLSRQRTNADYALLSLGARAAYHADKKDYKEFLNTME